MISRSNLAATLNGALMDIDAVTAPDPNTFRAVLPVNDIDARIFAVQGALAQANGRPPLSAWAVDPWAFVRPLDKAPDTSEPGRVVIAAMNGETRAGAVNLSNSTDQPLTVALSVRGRHAANLRDLQLYESVWTDTRELVPVADALVPLAGDDAVVERPAGMTRQIWLRFTPSQRAPGVYRGSLRATANDGTSVDVPFQLRVLAGDFPAHPSLHLGGWDYTDAERILGVTPGNRYSSGRWAIGVDSPWATNAVALWQC